MSNLRGSRRIHLPPEFLQNAKLAAGDFVVVKSALQAKELEDKVSISKGHGAVQEKSTTFVVAIAWPSFSGDAQNAYLSSSLMEQLSYISPGDLINVLPMTRSGLKGSPAVKLQVKQEEGGSKISQSDNLLLAYIKQTLIDIKCVTANQSFDVIYNGISRTFKISKLEFEPSRANAHIGLIETATSVSIEERAASNKSQTATGDALLHAGAKAGYSAIGGLSTQIEIIRELVELPLMRPELYEHFDMQPPRGILLHGPPGTGKTLLASTIALSLGVPTFSIAGASLSSPYHGETESRLRDIFNQAKDAGPSVIILDEVDALAPKREDSGEVEKRLVAELLTLMDGLDSKSGNEDEGSKRSRVVVVACTNRPNAIDPALRRPGRFDREIEIGIPDVEARLDILKVVLRKTPHALNDATLQSLAARTHGFVGADLASLVHSAGLNAIRRALKESTPLSDMRLQESDVEAAMLVTRPSAMREVFLELPQVRWADIGGQETVKQKLRECVEWPLTRKDTFKRLGIRPPAGILLYGPPGNSKTLIAKAMATEAGLNFLAVKGPEIFNKYVGESERSIRSLFQKARAAAPSILFLDEIDAIASSRSSHAGGESSTGDRVLTTLLTEMDGLESLQGVIVLAATNRPGAIDAALLRPGRLDRILYVAPPDLASRKAILAINLAKMETEPEVDIDTLAELADGCSGAELVSICQDAALLAMNENVDAPFVKQAHFTQAAVSMRRRITPDMLEELEAWRDQIGA